MADSQLYVMEFVSIIQNDYDKVNGALKTSEIHESNKNGVSFKLYKEGAIASMFGSVNNAFKGTMIKGPSNLIESFSSVKADSSAVNDRWKYFTCF